jgi:hypothetical protein
MAFRRQKPNRPAELPKGAARANRMQVNSLAPGDLGVLPFAVKQAVAFALIDIYGRSPLRFQTGKGENGWLIISAVSRDEAFQDEGQLQTVAKPVTAGR